jgi:hypothetical protein
MNKLNLQIHDNRKYSEKYNSWGQYLVRSYNSLYCKVIIYDLLIYLPTKCKSSGAPKVWRYTCYRNLIGAKSS